MVHPRCVGWEEGGGNRGLRNREKFLLMNSIPYDMDRSSFTLGINCNSWIQWDENKKFGPMGGARPWRPPSPAGSFYGNPGSVTGVGVILKYVANRFISRDDITMKVEFEEIRR